MRSSETGQRVELLSRFSTILLVGLLIVSTASMAYTLADSDRASARVHYYFFLGRDDQRMLLLLERQHFAERAYWFAPSAAQLKRFEDATLAFKQVLRHEARQAPAQDLADLQIVEEKDDAIAANSRYVTQLRRDGQPALAHVLERAVIQRDFDDTASFLESTSRAKFARAESFLARYNHYFAALETTAIWGGLFTIVISSGLLYAVSMYKRRADQALRDKMEQLERAALTDNLTRLGNHRAFYEDFGGKVARARTRGRSLTLALIDIDNFKTINDTNGHRHGDLILSLLATTLQQLPAEHRAYRIGGDEMAVLLIEANAADAATLLTHVQRETRQTLGGATVSIGFAELEPGVSEQELYPRADAALYEAKRRGRNTMVDFDAIRQTVEVPAPGKTAAVLAMLQSERIAVAFQPIWDVDDRSILGFEALMRPHPDFGLAGPQEAFDVAERINKVPELDALCSRNILAAAGGLPKDQLLFINLSPETLEQSAFRTDHFAGLVKATGLCAGQIVIEFTERRVGDCDALVRRAGELHASGMRIALRVALDDTGSGSAGLELLSKLPLDFVKIARSLLVKAIDGGNARALLGGIVAITQRTGSYLIAEGIENVELLDFIRRVHEPWGDGFKGIRGAQGYLLGKPLVGAPRCASRRAVRTLLENLPRSDGRLVCGYGRESVGQCCKVCRGRAVADPGEYSGVSKQGSSLEDLFKGRQFEGEITILCVRWYLQYTLSYRDLAAMMAERGALVFGAIAPVDAPSIGAGLRAMDPAILLSMGLSAIASEWRQSARLRVSHRVLAAVFAALSEGAIWPANRSIGNRKTP